jgi:putative membrane protein
MQSLSTILKGALATAVLVCLVSVGAFTQEKNNTNSGTQTSASSSSSGQLAASDKAFMKKAAQGGQAEVELGQLAAQKGQSDEVKKFGQRMVDDHSKANDQLKSIAQQKGVQLPTELDAKDKALKDKLSGLSGNQFDEAYMRNMVQDHKKDIAEFQKQANSGKDPDVKNFASQTLPTLQDHLKQAEQTTHAVNQGQSKKGSATASNQQH